MRALGGPVWMPDDRHLLAGNAEIGVDASVSSDQHVPANWSVAGIQPYGSGLLVYGSLTKSTGRVDFAIVDRAANVVHLAPLPVPGCQNVPGYTSLATPTPTPLSRSAENGAEVVGWRGVNQVLLAQPAMGVAVPGGTISFQIQILLADMVTGKARALYTAASATALVLAPEPRRVVGNTITY